MIGAPPVRAKAMRPCHTARAMAHRHRRQRQHSAEVHRSGRHCDNVLGHRAVGKKTVVLFPDGDHCVAECERELRQYQNTVPFSKSYQVMPESGETRNAKCESHCGQCLAASGFWIAPHVTPKTSNRNIAGITRLVRSSRVPIRPRVATAHPLLHHLDPRYHEAHAEA